MRARAVCAGLRGLLCLLTSGTGRMDVKRVEETLQDGSKQHEDKGEAEKASIADYERKIADYERKIEAERAMIADYERMIADYERKIADYERKIAETHDAAAIKGCRSSIKRCLLSNAVN